MKYDETKIIIQIPLKKIIIKIVINILIFFIHEKHKHVYFKKFLRIYDFKNSKKTNNSKKKLYFIPITTILICYLKIKLKKNRITKISILALNYLIFKKLQCK